MNATPTTFDALCADAAALGRDAGLASASWVFDGNTDESTYRAVLAGIEDGDPMVLDSFNWPNLSGEWVGDPTPQSLMSELGADGLTPEEEDDLCRIWEESASDAFIGEVERTARYMLAD